MDPSARDDHRYTEDDALAHELAGYRRSFEALGDGFRNASYVLPENGADDEAMLAATREFFRILALVDRPALEWAMQLLAAGISKRTGETARSIFERKFEGAPSDEWWKRVYFGEGEAPEGG